jgi:hypothetical protein
LTHWHTELYRGAEIKDEGNHGRRRRGKREEENEKSRVIEGNDRKLKIIRITSFINDFTLTFISRV